MTTDAPRTRSALDRATSAALTAKAQGEQPHAVCIELPGETFVAEFSRVLDRADPTAHGAIRALRTVGLLRHDPKLPESSTAAASGPLCPMCAAALELAGVHLVDVGTGESCPSAAAIVQDAEPFVRRVVETEDGPVAYRTTGGISIPS